MKADVSKVDEHLAFQFNITGEGEGIFYAEAKDGKLYVDCRRTLGLFLVFMP